LPAQNLEAEAALIGALLYSADARTALVSTGIAASDFYNPIHRHVYEAISALLAAGDIADAVTVAEQMRRTGTFDATDEGRLLLELQHTPPPSSSAQSVRRWARSIKEAAELRRLIEVATEVADIGYSTADVATARAKVTQAIDGWLTTTKPPVGASDLDSFLATTELDHDWLVAGLLERGDRVVLIGSEGKGKSTLLRQIGVQASNGTHPFTLQAVPPRRVLLLDLENPTALLSRELRRLRAVAGEPSGLPLIVCSAPAGIDLTTGTDRQWLDDLMREHRPDVMIGGPLYKMGSGNPSTEENAKPIADALDRLRIKYGCSIILEAHQPHGQAGGFRPERPVGWSGWMRWPEIGLHLRDDGRLTYWRPSRDDRDWQCRLRSGGVWPWTVDGHSSDPVHRQQDDAKLQLIADAMRHNGGWLSMREAARATHISSSAVGRIVKENRETLMSLLPELPGTAP
jgi:replicative DNA helicase